MNTLFETGQDGGTATTHDWLTPPEILQALGKKESTPDAMARRTKLMRNAK